MYGVCRICFRELAYKGEIPGVRKASGKLVTVSDICPGKTEEVPTKEVSMQIDPIADMLTRIRNAQHAKHPLWTIPASNMKKAICQILLDEGYIKGL